MTAPGAPPPTATRPPRVDGPTLFARYAYPPNERGYCGAADHRALLEYGASRTVDGGLADLARTFSGAWPYLALIAELTGIGDPLDRRVVHAYWVGNPLLDRLDMAAFGNALRDRFRVRAGVGWSALADAVPAGATPHHNFHVFEVYPWVGLLGADRGPTPLHILDRCRIRWGEVLDVHGSEATVRSRPLTWDGRRLDLGAPQVETATVSLDGYGLVSDVAPGDRVALHWRWICDRLGADDLAQLRLRTARQLRITNRTLGARRPTAALD